MITKRITDQFNPLKIWLVKRTSAGHYFINQSINGIPFYTRYQRTTNRKLHAIGIDFTKGVHHIET